MWSACKVALQKLAHQVIDYLYLDEEDYELLRNQLAFQPKEIRLNSGDKVWIRLARRNEYTDIFLIEQQAYAGKSPWKRELFYKDLNRNPRTIYLVIEAQGKKIAFLGARTTEGRDIHISNIAVLPEYRSLGCASALIVQLIQFAKILAKREITLEVRRSNLKAIHLYQRIGFLQTGVKLGYYQSEKEDAIEMTFALPNHEK